MRNTGLLRRLAAMTYDTLLVLAFIIVVTLLFNATQGGENVMTGGPLLVAAYNVVRSFVIYAFFIAYWYLRGQTLGMQAWRLRLQTAGGDRPTLVQCNLRFFVAIISLAAFGLGFVWQLWDRERLTWHDRASGTRLVHTPAA